jgi:hypothetical protein
MRALRAAFVACALLAAPAALFAQSVPAQHPASHPPKPNPNPHPRPSGGAGHRPSPNYSPTVYVDGTSVLNHYYSATPIPAPKHKATPHPSNGQEVFSTHSTDDAK